ncbi:uncharacterized protein K489DRAFT_410073 [Dissoconium aciculare CBS 342.82]|uniref:F-box domain-containing protein n=1 Tax=Dissoconium aciculare CBS 342.82 TaxID=1314786 RepID=A0A6J3M803_9PEZI|nr:uncharacterized protein K489DRAFT_410073 [Dissoconium aciculare CBS 342.82]KAF1822982.1 hypothetical protein K489DRAFT_410073 [Dissoconium aciculare CBS 342.82]
MASHFLGLPTELRFQIYTYLYTGERACFGHHGRLRKVKASDETPSRLAFDDTPALFLVSRHIASEARSVYFSNVTLQCGLEGRSESPQLSRWLINIGDESSKLLRHFEFRWDNYVDIAIDLTLLASHKREQSAAATSLCPSKCVMPAMGYAECDPTSTKTPCEACKMCNDSSAVFAKVGLNSILDQPPLVAISHPPEDDCQLRAASPESTLSSVTCAILDRVETTTHGEASPTVLQYVEHESCPEPITSPPTGAVSPGTHAVALLPSIQKLFEPPRSVRVGHGHNVTVQGMNDASQQDLWRAMDTPAFCDRLSTAISNHLHALLQEKTVPFMTGGEITQLVREVNLHASSMKWLFF